MSPKTGEWVRKAEHDYATMLRESEVVNDPNTEGICFHAQQTIEKLLKAYLVELGKKTFKSHDLVLLVEQFEDRHPEWQSLKTELGRVTEFGTATRYPGDDPTLEECRYAIDITIKMRASILHAIENSDQMGLSL